MATTPDYPILGPPRISALGFATVLSSNRSPAAPEAAAAYAAARGAGVDPAVLLAVFRKESTYGRFGKAARTRSWGNLRDPATGQFKSYGSWTAGAADTARLLAVYGRNQIRPGRNTSTVQTMPYVWAPSSDGNAPDAYGDTLARWIGQWQRQYPSSGSGPGVPPSSPPVGIPTSTPGPDPTFADRLAALGIPNAPDHIITPAEAERIVDALYPGTSGSTRAAIVAFFTGKAVGVAAAGGSTSSDPLTAIAQAIAGVAGALGGVVAELVVNGTLLLIVVGLGWSGVRDLLAGTPAGGNR